MERVEEQRKRVEEERERRIRALAERMMASREEVMMATARAGMGKRAMRKARVRMAARRGWRRSKRAGAERTYRPQ